MEPFAISTKNGIDPRPGVAGHSLPVVAMGSVPHIYRREGLSPGDPN